MHFYNFNIGDYTSHTRGLSLLEDIAYRRLIDDYYLNERPFNGCSTTVARNIGMLDQLNEVEYVLSRFFVKEGDFFVHKRIENDLLEYKKRIEQSSKAGKASAESRKNKGVSTTVQQNSNDRSTTVQRPFNQPVTNNQEPITNNYRVKEKIKKEKKQQDEKPEDVDDQVWLDFVSHRKNKRAAITQTVINGFRKEADKAGISINEALSISVIRGWIGFDASWLKNNQNNYQKPKEKTLIQKMIEEEEKKNKTIDVQAAVVGSNKDDMYLSIFNGANNE